MSRNSIIPQEPMAPISHPHFHQTYKYDTKLKEWNFIGFRCIRCGQVFKKQSTIDSHVESCIYILTTVSMAEKEALKQQRIITSAGEVWQPLETNQNYSDPK